MELTKELNARIDRLIENRDFGELSKELERLVPDNEHNPFLLLALGHSLFLAGKPSEAWGVFEEGIRRDWGSWDISGDFGIAWARACDAAGASQTAVQSLESAWGDAELN